MARQKRVTTVVSILIILSVLTLVIVYRFGLILHTSGSLARTAEDTHHIIASYIQKNSGKFPLSEDDLIQQGFLKKIKVDDNYEYYLKLGSDDRPDKGYYKCPNFKLLEILYRVKVEDIDRVGHKLYDKSTGEQILLIDGPYRRNLKTTQYEPISVKWYKLMLQEEQQADVSESQ
jgi:hypothetical protein